jgi:hypothetical protein
MSLKLQLKMAESTPVHAHIRAEMGNFLHLTMTGDSRATEGGSTFFSIAPDAKYCVCGGNKR